jgi:hypothetical protein
LFLFGRQNLLNARANPSPFDGGVAFRFTELGGFGSERGLVGAVLDRLMEGLARFPNPFSDAGRFHLCEERPHLLALGIGEVELAQKSHSCISAHVAHVVPAGGL